ncbi:MAG: hypothetical protein V1875_00335 [Candidatus Altiarchaeota archaeon]
MPDELISLRPKELGELDAVEDLNLTLGQIVSGRLEGKQLYTSVSLELDRLAGSIGIEPGKVVDAMLEDGGHRGIFKGIESMMRDRYGMALDSEALDSLVKSAYALDVLNKMVRESGSVSHALAYAASALKVPVEELMLSGRMEYRCDPIVRPDRFLEALRFNQSVLGGSSDNIYSVSMVATTGILLGVRNSLGNLIGVGEFIFDRDESFYVYSLCVAMGWEGYGVRRSLIRKAISLQPGRRFWTTVGINNPNAARTYFECGFRMVHYLMNYFGDNVSQLLLERTESAPPARDVPPLVEAFDPGRESQSIRYSTGIDYEGILNDDAFSIEGLEDFEGGMVLRLRKAGRRHWKRPVQQEAFPLPPTGIEVHVSEDVEDAFAANEIEKSTHGEASAESPQMLIRIARTGYLLLAKDARGSIAAELPAVFDVDGGLFCHGVTVARGFDEMELRYGMVGVAEKMARRHGRNRVWTTADTVDFPVMEANINRRGHVGSKVLLDYYGNGRHRMVVEKAVGENDVSEKAASKRPAWGDMPLAESFTGYAKIHDPDGVLTHSTNYGLIKSLTDKGFRVVYVIRPEEFDRPGENPHDRAIFVLRKGR